jgi:hypothetical protein
MKLTLAEYLAILEVHAGKFVPDMAVVATTMNKAFVDCRDVVYKGEWTSTMLLEVSYAWNS